MNLGQIIKEYNENADPVFNNQAFQGTLFGEALVNSILKKFHFRVV